MWIRSQNKYIIANVNSLRICKCDIDGCTYYSIYGNYDRYEHELGVYSSKEKALKVLDDIQEFNECTYSEMFQMPQDEDDAKDDVYGMDWNEEDDSKNSSRDEF